MLIELVWFVYQRDEFDCHRLYSILVFEHFVDTNREREEGKKFLFINRLILI